MDPSGDASRPPEPTASGPDPMGPDGRLVMGLVGVGVLHVDDDHVVDEANHAARVLLGPRRRDLRGRTVMEVFLDRHVDDLVRSATTDETGSVEVAIHGADVRQVLVRARRSPRGGTWLVVEDVSELRRLQLIRAEFIDNLSHELRTPVTNVGLLAETLAREVDAAGDAVPARLRERVARIEVETGHLGQMVTEMLDLSRIESGGPMAMIDDVDPVALAAAVAERLRVFADRQSISLAVEAPDPVGMVRGDEERLGQVLLNLVHNAVKFSPDGAAVVIRVTPRDTEVTIAVEDRGIGIPAAAQARVFERFYKVDRSRARGGGTGLGLAIARHIVEGHGGRIELVSRPGVGSTFTVILPMDDPGRAEVGRGGPAGAARGAGSSRARAARGPRCRGQGHGGARSR